MARSVSGSTLLRNGLTVLRRGGYQVGRFQLSLFRAAAEQGVNFAQHCLKDGDVIITGILSVLSEGWPPGRCRARRAGRCAVSRAELVAQARGIIASDS